MGGQWCECGRSAALSLLFIVVSSGLFSCTSRPHGGPSNTKARPHQRFAIEDLAWLEGHWLGTTGDKKVEVNYSSPAGGMILGASKEFIGDKVALFDFEHFMLKNGRLTMTPYPFGRKSVDFTLITLDKTARRATFENPDHDFPKTFIYHCPNTETLIIHIANDEMAEQYVLRRAER